MHFVFKWISAWKCKGRHRINYWPRGIIVVVWIKSYVFKTSSGFSVDCRINEEKVICYNLRLENNFRPNAPVVISMKVKKCETNIAIYSYALLRICVNGGQMSVRIAPPSLPPHQVVQQLGTSSPPSQLKYSSEGVIWMCRASFTNSSCPLPHGPAPPSESVGGLTFDLQ